jgi:hypothetical protein
MQGNAYLSKGAGTSMRSLAWATLSLYNKRFLSLRPTGQDSPGEQVEDPPFHSVDSLTVARPDYQSDQVVIASLLKYRLAKTVTIS